MAANKLRYRSLCCGPGDPADYAVAQEVQDCSDAGD